MFFPEGHLRIFIYTRPTDMRKSFRGLTSLTRNILMEDPLSEHLFMFVNRTGNYAKIFYFDRNGFCIWAKKLSQGTFHLNKNAGDKWEVNWTELKLILEGIDLFSIKQHKRFQLVKR